MLIDLGVSKNLININCDRISIGCVISGTKMPIVLTDNHSYFVGVIITSAVEFPILIKSRLIKDLPQDVEDKIDRKIAELHFNKKPISVINSQKDC